MMEVGMSIKRKIILGLVMIVTLLAVGLVFTGCSTDDGGDEDGIKVPKTWVKATVDADAAFYGLAYGNGVFVAATAANLGQGINAKIFWSVDGVTWTETDQNLSDVLTGTHNHYVYFFQDINTFLVVDRRGSNSDNGAGGNWAKSTDGKTWTKITGLSDVATAGGGAYGNGTAIIGSTGSNIIVWQDKVEALTNYWTQKATGVTGINWINGAAYGKGKFVITGMAGQIAYSGDAGTWTSVTWPVDEEGISQNVFGTATVNSIVFDGSRFLAVGGKPGVAATSPDGITWTQTTDIKFDTGQNDYLYAGYGPGVLIATWQGAASYTTDAYNWTLIEETQFGTNSINAIAYGAGKYVMVGGGGTIAYSTPE
jgi:hypothetical protein